jgi:hypothetical protein
MIKTAILTNQNSRSLPYPKLMIGESGTIVLFQDRSTGVVVLQGNSRCYPIGHFRNTWDFTAFSDYYQAITLQNELP